MRGNGSTARAVPNTLTKVLPSQPDPIAEENDLSDEGVDEQDDTESSQSSPARPRYERKIVSPDIVEIDLTGGEMSLKAFIESKKPTTEKHKYLAIAYYLKHHRNIDNVTMHHIFTCYRHMGWKSAKDVAQPLRDMKSKGKWFGKGKEKGSYTINHLGENVVNEMKTAE